MIKVSMSKDMQKLIDERAKNLNMTNVEYIKLLTGLDIGLQRYEELKELINSLCEQILHYQEILGLRYAPLDEIPILRIANIDLDDESDDK